MNTIAEKIGNANVRAIGRLITKQNNTTIYDKAVTDVEQAKRMIHELNKMLPYSLNKIIIVVEVISLKIMSDIVYDLQGKIKEADNGCFVCELEFEGGKILLKTK